MRGYLDLRLHDVKMKIGGAPLDEDLRRIEAVAGGRRRRARMAVDANGRFDLETALAYGRALEPYGLRWYEEAGDPLDYAPPGDARPSTTPAPLATGENLFSHQDARNLLRYGGMRPDRDVLQFDPALGYGLVEYLRTLDMLARARLVAAARASRTAATSSRSNDRGRAAASAATSPTPASSSPSAASPTTCPSRTATSRRAEAPGIGIERKAALHAVLAETLSRGSSSRA